MKREDKEREYSMGLVYGALRHYYLGSYFANNVRDNAAEALKGEDGENSKRIKKLTVLDFEKVVDYLIIKHPRKGFDNLIEISLSEVTKNYENCRNRKLGFYSLVLGAAFFAVLYFLYHQKPKEPAPTGFKKTTKELIGEIKGGAVKVDVGDIGQIIDTYKNDMGDAVRLYRNGKPEEVKERLKNLKDAINN